MADDSDIWAKARAQMVATQLVARGIKDSHVLAAMGKLPREQFLSPDIQALAYEDGALPIGEGQTISQPFIVARALELLALKPRDRVLEIGTGSGYCAAVLSRLVEKVITIERLPALADRARARLAALGIDNVTVITGDGTLGYPAGAPYDAILVTAGGPKVPEALKAELAPGGHMVIPVGASEFSQELIYIERHGNGFKASRHDPVRFVPLVGKEGWQA